MTVLLLLPKTLHITSRSLPDSLSLSHTHTLTYSLSLSPLSLTHTRLTHQALSLVINVTPLSHLLSFLRENLGVKVGRGAGASVSKDGAPSWAP